MTSSADIEITREGHLAIISLRRPRVRNAITLDMWKGIAAILDGLRADDGIRSVILTGENPDFSVGADISEFSRVRASAAQSVIYEEAVDAASEAIAASPKPVIAVISGYCLGGACHLAMACDFRFARPDARFGIPASRLSIVYGVRSTDRLRSLVGISHAKRILYLAEQFDGLHAHDIGFVDQLSDDPMTQAKVLAQQIAANAPLSISGAKLILNGLSQGSSDIEHLAKGAIDRAAESEDYKEGTIAFAEKRAPVFRGR